MWNGYFEWLPIDYYYYPQQEMYENYYSNCIDPTYENFQNPQYNYQSSVYDINFDLNKDLNQFINNGMEPIIETYSGNIENRKQYEYEQLILNELWQGNYIQTHKGDP